MLELGGSKGYGPIKLLKSCQKVGFDEKGPDPLAE